MNQAELEESYEYLESSFNFEKLLHLGGVSASSADRAFYKSAASGVTALQKARAAELYRAARNGFFHAAASGYAFTDPALIEQRFGRSIAANYPGATPTLIRFATSYWTLKLMNAELWKAFRVVQHSEPTVHAYLLGQLEREIASVFFPTPGPIRVPRFLRRRMQRNMIARSGAPIDVDDLTAYE